MTPDIPEPDWRRFKEVHAKLSERCCCQILEEVAAASRGPEASPWDRYAKVRKLIKERDKQMANAFGDFRRSTAVWQLGIMRRMQLLTDEELGQFSEETRSQVEAIASI
jgi:hypothetical protein